jgi:hypothetical protein
MLLNIIPGSIKVQPHGIAFRANYYGDKNVECRITRDALLDLAGYHQLSGRDDELFQTLRGEIDRLLSTKYRARRMESNGDLLLSSADLVLYGFESRGELPDEEPEEDAEPYARAGRG